MGWFLIALQIHLFVVAHCLTHAWCGQERWCDRDSCLQFSYSAPAPILSLSLSLSLYMVSYRHGSAFVESFWFTVSVSWQHLQTPSFAAISPLVPDEVFECCIVHTQQTANVLP